MSDRAVFIRREDGRLKRVGPTWSERWQTVVRRLSELNMQINLNSEAATAVSVVAIAICLVIIVGLWIAYERNNTTAFTANNYCEQAATGSRDKLWVKCDLLKVAK